MFNHTVALVLGQTLAIFLFICALTGIAVSLLLIFRPHLMARINRVASKWITTRHLELFFDRSISIEQWFYRHHSMFGVSIIMGAGYILVYFGLLFDKQIAIQRLASYAPYWQLDMLLDVLVLASLISAAAALLVGLFLWLRPSMLRGIEEKTNQWLSSRRALRFLEIPRDEVERVVVEHAPRIGWLLLLGSLCLLFLLLRAMV